MKQKRTDARESRRMSEWEEREYMREKRRSDREKIKNRRKKKDRPLRYYYNENDLDDYVDEFDEDDE